MCFKHRVALVHYIPKKKNTKAFSMVICIRNEPRSFWIFLSTRSDKNTHSKYNASLISIKIINTIFYELFN